MDALQMQGKDAFHPRLKLRPAWRCLRGRSRPCQVQLGERSGEVAAAKMLDGYLVSSHVNAVMASMAPSPTIFLQCSEKLATLN